jgi:adenylate kinase
METRTMNVILVGPPGAGKGTQAAVLEEKTDLKHIASGELFRQHLRDETELGLAARKYMDNGDLVPNDVVIGMILDRVFQPDCEKGVIFDGFPRTKEQADALAQSLEEHDQTIDAVVFLSAPREEGICDLCSGDLYTRSDDNMETARHRLDVYLQQTAPLIEHYRALGLLHEVNGLGDIHEVTMRLVQELGIKNGNGHH